MSLGEWILLLTVGPTVLLFGVIFPLVGLVLFLWNEARNRLRWWQIEREHERTSGD